jgi:hypothetical protein
VGVPPTRTLAVPPAAGLRGDGPPHRRAHEEAGVKTVGFLGYTDAYGELWLKEFTPQAEAAGIKVVAAERFARSDTSVTPQALKLVSANPDAMLVVASGSGAAMPHKAIIERGFKGKVYQTHAAATPDLVRIGGKDVEGSLRRQRPGGGGRAAARQPPVQGGGEDFVTKYEKAYGKGSRNQFAGHAYDAEDRAGEGPAGGAEEGQARHAGVPRRAARRGRDHGPHGLLARRDELDADRPLGLHDGDRRDAQGRRTASSS